MKEEEFKLVEKLENLDFEFYNWKRNARLSGKELDEINDIISEYKKEIKSLANKYLTL